MDEHGAAQPLAGHPRYQLREELGRGAFGVVYRAHDRERSRDIALKLLQELSERSLSDLRSELRARADVHHPHLLQVYGLESDGERAFLTMELVHAPVTFVAWVRGGAVVPEAPLPPEIVGRICRATHGLVSALSCLHGAGFVHRDVKPENVLVDGATGEVRLLDFGLAAPRRTVVAEEHSGYLYGTPAYMAPELLWRGEATPASDLYGVGAMLLEALTGHGPEPAASGDAEVRLPAPSPPGLVELVRGLLAPDPAARLDARAVSEHLRALAPGLPIPELRSTVMPPFVGRERERRQVLAALERPASVVWIRGPSGIGKTSFVQHVLSSWRGHGERMVLRGRCHPQEHVRFRAWDEIAAQLEGLVGRELLERTLAPADVAALRTLFPGFASALDDAPAPLGSPDADLRRIAVSALRALLHAVSEKRPLLVWIDDLQWANDDSLALLADLLERGTGQTSWIFACRGEDHAGLLARLGRSSAAVEVDVALGRLDRADVARLLRDLGAGDRAADVATMDLLAELPMFAPELAAARSSSPGSVENPHEALVALRTEGVPERRLRVLDVVAACPRPIPWALLADAVDQPAELFDDFLALRQAGLLRRSTEGAGARVWTFHDIVRRARLDGMPAPRSAEIHGLLVRAYDAHAPDEHEALAHHLEQVGDTGRAAASLTKAGIQALEQLGFASAAGHFDRAFALDPQLAGSWQIQARRAECDASRGLSRAAGERFEQAAKLRERSEGASASLKLGSRAARELIRCGQIESGYEIFRRIMERLGTRLPRSHAGTLAWSAALRARLVLREPARRSATPTAETSARLDALWTGCTALSHLNPALADVFLLRHLLLALEGGDPSNVTKALTFEAVAEATLGGSFLLRRSDVLMARGRALCEAHGDDYDWGWYWTARASRSTFDGDWAAAVEHAEKADTYFERRRHGVAWERSVARIYRAIAVSMTGDAPALRAVVSAAQEDAREREDPVAENGVTSGHPAILRLFDDAPDPGADAPRGIERGTRWPSAAYVAPDYYDMVADAERLLYLARPREALARVERDLPALRSSGLLRLRFVGIDARYLLARARLDVASGLNGGARRRLVAEISADARAVARAGERLSEAYTQSLEGGIAALAGQEREAITAYAAAAAAFEGCGMAAHAAAAEHAAAVLRGAPEAARGAEARLGALGAARPARIAALLVPAPDRAG